jgi:hypothetical protein
MQSRRNLAFHLDHIPPATKAPDMSDIEALRKKLGEQLGAQQAAVDTPPEYQAMGRLAEFRCGEVLRIPVDAGDEGINRLSCPRRELCPLGLPSLAALPKVKDIA